MPEPLHVLVEDPRLEPYPLPDALRQRYGGPFALPSPCLYANFVASVDGVVSLGRDDRHSGSAISGHNDDDRFVMGLLRACADAVLIGAGTLRATPGHQWTAERVYPDCADEFTELRKRLGKPPRPQLVVVTESGDIAANHAGLVDGTMVLAPESAAARLRKLDRPGLAVRAIGQAGAAPAGAIVATVRAEGHRAVLCEGGPRLAAELLRERLLDELFLTVAPVLLGRIASDGRLTLIDGASFPPSDAQALDLVSLRRGGSFLFARYAVRKAASKLRLDSG